MARTNSEMRPVLASISRVSLSAPTEDTTRARICARMSSAELRAKFLQSSPIDAGLHEA